MAPICAGGSLSALPTTSTNSITGTWAPALNNAATTTYTFTPTAGQCGTTTTLTITVNPNVTPTFTAVSAICAGGSLSALPTTSNNGIVGSWSPALDNANTTTYTFTPTAGQCATTTTLTITVNPNVTPTFTAVAPICAGGSLSALPTTSNNGITGTWSPALDNANTTTYTFSPTAGQCATTATLSITVNPTNVTPTFTAVASICSGGSLSALPTTSNNGIAGTWSPALDNANTTTYTFTPTAGLCATTTTLTITVNPNVTPTFTAVAAICSGGSLSALPTTSNNGITGTWSPALDDANTTTYTFTPTAGQCATTATLSITVNPNVTPTFTAVAAICSGGSLSALPTTSNNGITGTWSPALDNANTTTYTFSPTAGQCATTTTLTITVNPNVTPTFTAVAAICAGGSLSALPTTSNNGITGTWSPALNNAATTIYTFIPTVGQCATTTTLTITVNPSPPGDTLATAINVVGLNYTTTGNNLASNCYTNTIGSTSPDVWYKVTIEPCVRTISLNTCSGTNYDSRLRVYAPDGTTQLANNDDYCGLQSGIDNLNVSLYSFVYVIVEGFTTNQGNYGLSISQNVVNTATFAAVAPICSGSVLTALPTSSIEGFTGTWSPALDNTQTTTYTFTPDANQCATATVTLTIVVNPIPVVAITGATSICAGDSVTLTANGADTYSWNSIFLPTTIPLDNVSNARLAIGLRKLKTTYTGPCVRLRRSSDNAESDFGFSGNDLDSSAVTTWLNGATGYCVTLYDQSGNGGDVSQSSTFNQPTLTLNGFNGKPVLHFNTQQLLLNNVNYPSSYTAIYGARQTGGARARVLSAVNNNWLLGYWGGAKRQAYFEGWISSNPGNPASDDNYYIYSGASDGSTSQLYENGTLIENNGNGVASPNGIELNGWINGSEMSDCDFTDVFVFDTVLNTTDRAFVENSTKNYYNPIPTPSITVSPTVTTTYTVTGTNAIGCSATASITVTVNPVTSNTSTISACNSYLWTVNGTTYTTSGTYTSVVNCNTETLILTINNSTTNGSLTTSAAGSYTWAGPLGSGLTYNTSGVYTFTTTNAFGCPNVATLNLTITSVATVNTFVIGTSCGSTITNLSVTIIAPFVSGATLYTFRLTNLVTNVVQLINRPVNSFALSGFAGVTLGTPYKVEVSVNNGPFGAPCNVITPTPVATIGTQCGTTLTAMSQFVYCNFVANVTGYRFRVTNTTTSTIQIFDSGLNRFNFNQLPNRSFSTTYFVEVALRNTDGTYLPYNTGCNILTPSFPTSEIRLSQCDYNALSNTESFVATLVSGATEYRFNIFNTSLGYTSTLDRTLNTFNLNMFSGLLAGTTYSVRVAVKIGGVFGPYGKICNLTTPGGTRMVATTKVKEFKAILYPNPFAESFMLDVKNSTESTIQIKVYDMLGRLVDNRDVEISDITSIQVGATYPSGVYNVIISQDANTQTIRVIKR